MAKVFGRQSRWVHNVVVSGATSLSNTANHTAAIPPVAQMTMSDNMFLHRMIS